jgi:Transposase
MAFSAALAPCLIGMEACATAHYWARELRKLGHEVRLMPAKDVKAYLKRNKNDAADAEAICEAVRRPTMRFVQIKSAEQQGQLMQHRTRDVLIRQRTQIINALQAHLAELGIVAAQGDAGVNELRAIVADDRDARASVMVLAAQLEALQTLIGSIEKRIKMQHRSNEVSRRVETIPGIGGGDRDRGDGGRSEGVSVGTRFCGLDRAGAAPGFDRRQAETRADVQAGRPLLAAHSRRRGDRRVAARPGESREVSLAHATPDAAALQGRGGGALKSCGNRFGAARPTSPCSGGIRRDLGIETLGHRATCNPRFRLLPAGYAVACRWAALGADPLSSNPTTVLVTLGVHRDHRHRARIPIGHHVRSRGRVFFEMLCVAMGGERRLVVVHLEEEHVI